MKILLIVGQNLSNNNSANLCHLAYLKGLIDIGADVTLLSAEGSLENIDIGKEYHHQLKIKNYKDSRFYHRFYRNKIAPVKNSNTAAVELSDKKVSFATKVKTLIVKIVRALTSVRSVYGTNYIWYKNAKKYKNKEEEFDYIISLSWPTISHKLANYLLKKGRVSAKKHIQIWEDPWYGDLYISQRKNRSRIQKEESRLLNGADKIFYVTPITLKNQQNLFKVYANKMFWEPLPSYYEENQVLDFLKPSPQYGYFGEYFPHVRNLAPFVDAAKEMEVSCVICGNPKDLFVGTSKLKIYPRMPLEELKEYERDVDVLVFVSNLSGGQIPGKIYQYSATKKYILFILDGTEEEQNTLEGYFKQFERYVFCKNNKKSIIEGMKQIEELYKNKENVDSVDYFKPERVVARIIGEEI